MAKNLIPEISKLLGLEIGEEFKINDGGQSKYKFSNEALELFRETDQCWIPTNGITLCELLQNNFKIIKLPWKPKVGDYYWTFVSQGFVIARVRWTDGALDFARLKAGVIFRTEVEALRKRPLIYEELTGKEWCEGEE